MTTVFDLDSIDVDPIVIPLDIAVCPYCGGKLYVSEINEYSIGEDGEIVAEHISLDCSSTPDAIKEPMTWEEWNIWHSQMPYVNWLPLEEPVKAWLNKTYTLVHGDKVKAQWSAWVKACGAAA